MGDAFDTPAQQPEEKDYKPFPRMREGNPYRLLGLGEDASFDEVQEARNYLVEQYRWHEPSRESIELAFDSILNERYKTRNKLGFRPVRLGRRGQVLNDVKDTWERRLRNLFDPTITTRTLVNEGAIYLGLALWALFSSDQSFPLTGAFAYSVYMFQQKRVKREPEGPFFGGNPIVGAILTTCINLGLGCALGALITMPLEPFLTMSVRSLGSFLVVLVMGALGVYLK